MNETPNNARLWFSSAEFAAAWNTGPNPMWCGTVKSPTAKAKNPSAAILSGSGPGWIVSGVPATLRGVPLFVNGFPEAARPSLGEPILMAPAQNADGRCRLTWSGEAFRRD